MTTYTSWGELPQFPALLPNLHIILHLYPPSTPSCYSREGVSSRADLTNCALNPSAFCHVRDLNSPSIFFSVYSFSLFTGLFFLVFGLKFPVFETKCSPLSKHPPLPTVTFLSFKLNDSKKLPSLTVSLPFHPTHYTTHSNLTFAPLMDPSVDQFDGPMSVFIFGDLSAAFNIMHHALAETFSSLVFFPSPDCSLASWARLSSFHVGIPQGMVIRPPLLFFFILFPRWSPQHPHVSCHPDADDSYLFYFTRPYLFFSECPAHWSHCLPDSWPWTQHAPSWILFHLSPDLISVTGSPSVNVSTSPTVAQARNLEATCDCNHFLIPQIQPIWKSCWLCPQSMSWLGPLHTTSAVVILAQTSVTFFLLLNLYHNRFFRSPLNLFLCSQNIPF